MCTAGERAHLFALSPLTSWRPEQLRPQNGVACGEEQTVFWVLFSIANKQGFSTMSSPPANAETIVTAPHTVKRDILT